MRIALVAGEASGDTLGAALIDALRRRFPGAQFAGVAGPSMIAAGCNAVVSQRRARRHGSHRGPASPAAPVAAARRPATTHSRMAAGRLHRRRFQGIQPGARAASQEAGTAHRPVRESPGLGVATGSGAHHRRSRRPHPLPVSLRAGFLSRIRRARDLRRPSAGRPDSDAGRSLRGPGRAGYQRRRARARVAAGQPARRSRTPRRCPSPARPNCSRHVIPAWSASRPW